MTNTLICLLFLSFSFSISAQNCSDWIENKYDDVSGITIKSMKDRLYINKDGQRKVSIFIAQKIEDGEKEMVLTIDIKDGGCINNQNGIIFLFTDGSRLKELNHSSDNCVGFAMLNLGISDYDGNTIRSYLVQKKIKTLRVYTNNTFVQVDFTELNQEKLMNTLRCID